MSDLAPLLDAVRAGEPGAADRLYAQAYAQLRVLARSRLQRAGPITLLNPTALVHEAFMRMAGAGAAAGGAAPAFADVQHFWAYAARAMRSVVVDLVRSRLAERHGGGQAALTLSTLAEADASVAAADPAEQVLQVHQALQALERDEPRLAQVVELRYFGGLQDTEIAALLGLTVRTVQRDWAKARLYLSEALR